MRGASSFDGKLTGNRQMVDRYNEAKGKGKKKESLKGAGAGADIGTQPKSLPKTRGGESGGVREAGGHDEIKNVVMEHGKAHGHHIYDRGESSEGGRYHSVTHHEDGYVHHADHENMEDAQAHAAHAHEDTAHLGDMPKEDYGVAKEDEGVEQNPNTGTSRVGYMS